MGRVQRLRPPGGRVELIAVEIVHSPLSKEMVKLGRGDARSYVGATGARIPHAQGRHADIAPDETPNEAIPRRRLLGPVNGDVRAM